MKPLTHVALLAERAVTAKLKGADWAVGHGAAWLQKAYNGIGPEYLGGLMREKITEILALFEPAALIHDARNQVSDGTRAGFEAANEEFYYNCVTLAERAYPWYSWRRYRARAVAWTMYEFVNGIPGYIAWMEAAERR